jgi:hypothetical protein
MARAKKLWRPLKVRHRHEWVPFATAWARAEQVVGPGSHTRNELQQAFRGRQLVAAVQLIAEDGAETWIILERECWRWLQIHHAWAINGWRLLPGWWKAEGGPEDRQRGRRHVLVHRRELDKHYPAAAAMPSESPSTTKSKPGSADAWIDHVCPNGEWRLMTAKDIHKKILPEAKTLGVKAPSYSAVAAALLKR